VSTISMVIFMGLIPVGRKRRDPEARWPASGSGAPALVPRGPGVRYVSPRHWNRADAPKPAPPQSRSPHSKAPV